MKNWRKKQKRLKGRQANTERTARGKEEFRQEKRRIQEEFYDYFFFLIICIILTKFRRFWRRFDENFRFQKYCRGLDHEINDAENKIAKLRQAQQEVMMRGGGGGGGSTRKCVLLRKGKQRRLIKSTEILSKAASKRKQEDKARLLPKAGDKIIQSQVKGGVNSIATQTDSVVVTISASPGASGVGGVSCDADAEKEKEKFSHVMTLDALPETDHNAESVHSAASIPLGSNGKDQDPQSLSQNQKKSCVQQPRPIKDKPLKQELKSKLADPLDQALEQVERAAAGFPSPKRKPRNNSYNNNVNNNSSRKPRSAETNKVTQQTCAVEQSNSTNVGEKKKKKNNNNNNAQENVPKHDAYSDFEGEGFVGPSTKNLDQPAQIPEAVAEASDEAIAIENPATFEDQTKGKTANKQQQHMHKHKTEASDLNNLNDSHQSESSCNPKHKQEDDEEEVRSESSSKWSILSATARRLFRPGSGSGRKNGSSYGGSSSKTGNLNVMQQVQESPKVTEKAEGKFKSESQELGQEIGADELAQEQEVAEIIEDVSGKNDQKTQVLALKMNIINIL